MRPCAIERERELPGNLGFAQPGVQAADAHGIRFDVDHAVHGRAAEVRQRRAHEPLERRQVVGVGFNLEACGALARFERTAGMQPCAVRLDVERERPGLGAVLEQPQWPAFEADRKGEALIQSAARGQAQRLIARGAARHLVHRDEAARSRARVEVVNVQPVQHDAGKVDAGLRRLGITRWRRRPVATAVSASLQPQADFAGLDAA